MSEIYFIRHGKTQWNLDGRLQGQTDVPLAEVGKDQVIEFIPQLKNLGLEKIVSSSLQRTFETGKILAEAYAIPIEIKNELIERSFGSFEGLTRETLMKDHGLKAEERLSGVLPDDAESLESVGNRVWPIIEECIAKEQKILLVSHAGVFRALWETRPVQGVFIELKFGQIWKISNNGTVWNFDTLTQ